MSKIGMSELKSFSNKASAYLYALQDALNEPHPSKTPPTFTYAAVADLCGVNRTQMRYLASKHGLPLGVKPGIPKERDTRPRELSLEETILWVKTIANLPTRQPGQRGRVVAVCNYKGGVAKTSTAVSLAQALTLRGLKVLLVDCDAQGSATQLCGYKPEKEDEVDYENTTILPYIHGDHKDLAPAVLKTYWHNLWLIPACSAILTAEFLLPTKAIEDSSYRFWEVLRNGIEPLRDEYDAIIFDTPPSLGHVTLNVMFAADGLIMPCPPEKLDFTSSVQFWNVFNELTTIFSGVENKTYDFITIVPTKVEPIEGHRITKTWMQQAYGEFLNAIEIPKSAAANLALTQDRTIFDFTKPEGSPEAYRRYKEPMNHFVDYVLRQIATGWSDSND